MAAVPEGQRIKELRRLGPREPVVGVVWGGAAREMFRHSCVGPPYSVSPRRGPPAGPPFAPLWDCNDTVVGVWSKPDGPEFIEFSIETEDEYTPLARTEQ